MGRKRRMSYEEWTKKGKVYYIRVRKPNGSVKEGFMHGVSKKDVERNAKKPGGVAYNGGKIEEIREAKWKGWYFE